MSQTKEPNVMSAWFLRRWRMLYIVTVGIVIAVVSIRSGNWTLAIPLSAIIIGVALNIVAMLANRGRMPVDTDDASIDELNHQTMHKETRFRILGDWIPFAGWLLSPGDVLLAIGLLGYVFCRLTQSAT